MNSAVFPWQVWALLAAAFAALTAIFGKVGVEHINSDFPTVIRTEVTLALTAGIVATTGAWQPLASVSSKSWIFLTLSGLATGASWLCYYRALKLGPASQVAPIDKLSIVLVAIFATLFLGEKLTPKNWLGVVLVAAGALLVATKR